MQTAEYVATFDSGWRGTTHGIRDGWSYDRIAEARTWCGRSGPFAINSMHSGTPMNVTCGRCLTWRNRPKE